MFYLRENMLYLREIIFANKLLASLKLNGCHNVDISDENIKIFMPNLEQMLDDMKMFQSTDELRLLFSCDINGDYTDLFKIINEIDPLVAEKENDELHITMDSSVANTFIDNDEYFPKEKMLELGKKMKPLMSKKEKVRIYAYN